MEWYRTEIDEVFKKLQTSEKGLSETEAEDRLEKEGPNRLPEGKGLSRFEILLHQFKSPLIYILLVAAIAVTTMVLFQFFQAWNMRSASHHGS
jgi:P-type Ca2+ transporter type 2C